MALALSMWVCCSLLIHSPSGLAESLGKPALQMPGSTFGGVYRRMLDNTPVTLDPTFYCTLGVHPPRATARGLTAYWYRRSVFHAFHHHASWRAGRASSQRYLLCDSRRA
jgi:hypothetical protein